MIKLHSTGSIWRLDETTATCIHQGAGDSWRVGQVYEYQPAAGWGRKGFIEKGINLSFGIYLKELERL